jgi:hypothetical protein
MSSIKRENWYVLNKKGELVEGVNSSMIYLIHCKNFCKCHNVPSPCKIIIIKKNVIGLTFLNCQFGWHRKGPVENKEPS